MKKGVLIFASIGIIVIIAISVVTYAFFAQNKVDFVITLESAVTSTVILEVDTDTANALTPPVTKTDKSYGKYAGSNNYAAYKISYRAEADIASASIYVTDINFSRSGVEDTSSPEYLYLSQSGVFEFGFKLYANIAPENVVVSTDNVVWVNGTGDENGTSLGTDPFDSGDEGTIVFFVRFSSNYPDELVPPACNGMEIYFTINMDVTDRNAE